MPEIIIVKHNGDIVEKKIKQINEDELYKVCNYKNNKHFQKLHSYVLNENEQCIIYGKTDGKAGNENKYDLPPPLDNSLFFGSLCIFKMNGDEYDNIKKQEWEKIYEQLFGGFENLDNSDEDERSADSEVFSDDNYTKEGYLKDEFVVEDDELKEEDYLTEEED